MLTLVKGLHPVLMIVAWSSLITSETSGQGMLLMTIVQIILLYTIGHRNGMCLKRVLCVYIPSMRGNFSVLHIWLAHLKDSIAA